MMNLTLLNDPYLTLLSPLLSNFVLFYKQSVTPIHCIYNTKLFIFSSFPSFIFPLSAAVFLLDPSAQRLHSVFHSRLQHYFRILCMSLYFKVLTFSPFPKAYLIIVCLDETHPLVSRG